MARDARLIGSIIGIGHIGHNNAMSVSERSKHIHNTDYLIDTSLGQAFVGPTLVSIVVLGIISDSARIGIGRYDPAKNRISVQIS